MDDGALEALVPVLERDHPLHVGRGDFQAGEDEGDGSLHHRLAPLRGEVPQHLLLRGGKGACCQELALAAPLTTPPGAAVGPSRSPSGPRSAAW